MPPAPVRGVSAKNSLESPHLLLVGGGHAMLPSLEAAGAWLRSGAAVTLLTDHPHLYYSGMMPEYLGGVYSAAEVRIDLAAMAQAAGVRLVLDQAVGLDAARQEVLTATGARLPYALAAFDVGGTNPFRCGDLGIATKPLHHVREVAERLAAGLSLGRLVVVGGGAAGVEVLLNLSARQCAGGRAVYAEAVLVEPAPRLLPGFPSGLADHAARLLRERGVALRCGCRVEAAHPGAVVLDDGTHLPTDTLLWATGTQGYPFFAQAGLPTDAGGIVWTGDDLRVEGHDTLFAAGDCGRPRSHPGLARVGVHAVKQGPVLRDNLAACLEALLRGRPLPEQGPTLFTPYPIAPLILSTGRREGLWQAGGLWLRGASLLALKHFVDRRWMRKYSPYWAGRPWRHLIDARSASD